MTEEEHLIDFDKEMDKSWAEAWEQPGHKIIEPINPPEQPDTGERYVEHARRLAGGRPVLDSYFTDPEGKIARDPQDPTKPDRFVIVRGLGPKDGWTPIKRDQEYLNRP